MFTLDRIKTESPEIKSYGGGQWAFYAVGCCWWTSVPGDLGRNYADLPCCPHCGSVLLQAPLLPFLQAAESRPQHYGPGGLDTFLAAYSRNCDTCHQLWIEYYDANPSPADGSGV